METVQFIELDSYCQKVLAKNFPSVPIHDDIKTFNTESDKQYDIISGGYPCQPFSIAGKQKGFEDDRDLWPEMFRIVASTRPRWVVAENVAGHVRLGLDRTLSDLESIGYTCWPSVIPACAVDAPHRRDRVWLVAHDDTALRNQSRRRGGQNRKGTTEPSLNGEQGALANTTSKRRDTTRITSQALSGSETKQRPTRCSGSLANTESAEPQGIGAIQSRWKDRFTDSSWWLSEPRVGRVAHGVPNRVDRLKGLGNAIVPQVAERIGAAIMAVENS